MARRNRQNTKGAAIAQAIMEEYHLPQGMMVFFFSWNTGITCRIMDAASSSLDSFI
ncbi:MAG: hypothetical protein HFH43_15065 [Lachnospiraceae bacterium]|nr:hypothetical protein [Lachnospiraceae bacterium]